MPPVKLAEQDARVRRTRAGSMVTIRWFCTPLCAAVDPLKATAKAVTPAGVPKGKRCAVCNRKLAER